LRAAVLAFQALIKVKYTQKTTVALHLDNCGAVHAINKVGSSQDEIWNDLALELWHDAIAKKVFWKAVYLPGKLDYKADWASRFSRKRDWRLDPIVFQRINSILGPLSLDLFASHLNHQLADYCSWFPDPKTKAVDAFSFNWPKEGGYVFHLLT
jgi:hypothetical protein